MIYNDEKNSNDAMNHPSFRDELEFLFTKDVFNVSIVSLTICGDLNSIDAVESKIKKEVPVVVLKGSGGASDIIAFAFEEMSKEN